MSATHAQNIVFVSYSREDVEWRRRFTEMLRPLAREWQLQVWSDDRMVAGYEWRPQLAEMISRSTAALLLVSPSFLASDFIMDYELPALVAQCVPLVPVLVRDCLWQDVPILEGVQWAHDPRRDGPVAAVAHPEGEIVRICLALRGLLVGEDVSPRTAVDVAQPPVVPQVVSLISSLRPGELHDVPELPPAFVPRAELSALRDLVLAAETGAAGVTGEVLGISGQGGIGKTVLATALARDDDVRRHFPGGVFWVRMGEAADLVGIQTRLLEELGAQHQGLRSASEGVRMLRDVLADRRCLLVVDDVWSTAAAAAFRAVGPAGRVLYTTRDPAVLHAVGAHVQTIGALSPGAARRLLIEITGLSELPAAEADRICAATGRVALAVALTGAAIAGGRDWERVAAELEDNAATFLRHPYANVFKAMQVAVAALSEADAWAYRALAVYPEDTAIPPAAITRLWLHLHRAPARVSAARLKRLRSRNLLTVEHDGIRFHDLQREFLLLHTQDLCLLHADLLAAYRKLLPSNGVDWARLPPDEPYIWDHLLFHLRGAGDGQGIRTLVCDLGYIAIRSFLSEPRTAEQDLRKAADLFPGDIGVIWLLRLLEQWGHLLVHQPTAGDLAVTLASRACDGPVPATVKFGGLAALLPAHYLAPRWGLPTAPGSLDRVQNDNAGPVDTVVFSPNGQLASAGYDGTIRLWDPSTGQLGGELRGHDGPVSALAFSRDGQLASAGFDGTIRLWDPSTGQPGAVLRGHDRYAHAVAFSPDGQQLASSGYDGTVRLWDTATGHGKTLGSHNEVLFREGLSYSAEVLGVAFSPNGRQLASCGMDGTVRLWDASAGQPGAVLQGHDTYVLDVAFSSEGKLASADWDGTVRLWDPSTGKQGAVLRGHAGFVQTLAFSPDGQQLASGGRDGTLRVWDSATGELKAVMEGHVGQINTLAFSPDGQQLASGGRDGTVRLWDTAFYQDESAANGYPVGLGGVAFSSDGRQAVTIGHDAKVRLWDLTTGHPGVFLQDEVGQVDPGQVSAVAFSPDGQQIVSGACDGIVRLWDIATGQPSTVLYGHVTWLYRTADFDEQPFPHGNVVTAVAFSQNGRQVVSGDDDGTLRLWDISTGKPGATLEGRRRVGAVAFSPDHQHLASAVRGGTVGLWDTVTGRLEATLDGHGGEVYAIAYSPDGQQLATASEDGTVGLWDTVTGRLEAALDGHEGKVYAIAYSPDGQQLVSAGYDGTLRLWDRSAQSRISQLAVGVQMVNVVWGSHGMTAAMTNGLLHLAIVHTVGS